MRAAIIIDGKEVQLALADFRGSTADIAAMLAICGELMRTSIARTFREEGSPAGSWPALAESTMKHKGYTAGHKLLVFSGRLFGSISYIVETNTLTIGTDLVYAAVHQFGSKDWMGGALGPAPKDAMAAIEAHASHRLKSIHYQLVEVLDRHGRTHRVPQPMRKGPGGKLYRGPQQQLTFTVRSHSRRQNIPARSYLVFRPEDPDRMVAGIQQYLGNRAVRLGQVGAA